MRELKETHMIRLSGILLVDSSVLLIEQNIGTRKWYLPGGKLEKNETLEEGIIREIREETGAVVEVEKMICIADTEFENPATLHILFLLNLCGGEIGVQNDSSDTVPITNVKFVPINELVQHGFSENFAKACECGLKNIPTYVGMDTFFNFSCIDFSN